MYLTFKVFIIVSAELFINDGKNESHDALNERLVGKIDGLTNCESYLSLV